MNLQRLPSRHDFEFVADVAPWSTSNGEGAMPLEPIEKSGAWGGRERLAPPRSNDNVTNRDSRIRGTGRAEQVSRKNTAHLRFKCVSRLITGERRSDSSK